MDKNREAGQFSGEQPLRNIAKASIRLQQAAQRKRVYASTCDPIREDCDLGEARLLEREATTLLAPPKPPFSRR